MTATSLLTGFKATLTSRTAKVAGTVITSVFMGACAALPDRVVDSCMKRGGAFNFMGVIAHQSADEFRLDCDQGRDVALIAATPSREGGRDFLAALVAASTAAQKSPEALEHYRTQLKLRGMTHEQVMAAADKLNREVVKGVLVCAEADGKEICSYQKPQNPDVLPIPNLKGTTELSGTKPAPTP